MRFAAHAVFAALVLAAVAAAAPAVAAGPSAAALALGERLYRDGLLPSGEPVRAVVEGDIPIDGTLMTCQNCHMRSGLGSTEGTVLTLPTNGRSLGAPYYKGPRLLPAEREQVRASLRSEPLRPAYTDETLARAIRLGIDPGGRRFHGAMPRYVLNDEEMALLTAYLWRLAAEPSPGVDERTMTFAIVTSDDVPAGRIDSMLRPLEAYIAARAFRAPYYQKRARSGPYKEKMDVGARVPRLLRWELRGPRETWPEQLEAHYRREPVFALLGGMVSGSWEPVHRFCEQQRLPALLPLTDMPFLAEGDWYTLYASKGRHQEGETAARFLRRHLAAGAGGPIVSVVGGAPGAAAAAEGFAGALRLLGLPEAREVRYPAGADDAVSREALVAARGGVLALWLDGAQVLPLLEQVAVAADPPRAVLAASGLLAGHLGQIPEGVRGKLYLTWPRRLPGEGEGRDAALRGWLRVNGIEAVDFEVAEAVYVLGWLLTDALMMLGQDTYRDHLLDVIDMGQDRTHTAGPYPRLSFGQGQRFCSKGCYVVQLGPGPTPQLVPRSGWVVH